MAVSPYHRVGSYLSSTIIFDPFQYIALRRLLHPLQPHYSRIILQAADFALALCSACFPSLAFASPSFGACSRSFSQSAGSLGQHGRSSFGHYACYPLVVLHPKM